MGLLAVVLFATTVHVPLDYYNSDARGTLLTAQELVEHGTVRLDAYPDADAQLGNRIIRIDGHAYYYFPLGTPLLAVPAVWMARACGLDMNRAADDRRIQAILASTLLVLAFLLAYAVARLHLGPAPGLAVAVAFGFGSTLTSLLGSALWSQDAAIVLTLLGLYLLGREEAQGRSAPAALLGALAALAFVCRPTAALFGLLVGAYLSRRRPRRILSCLGGAGLVLAPFALWSRHEFGQLAPPYYLPQRVGGDTLRATALVANLVSPGRGFFVYNPILLVTLIGVAVWWRRLASHFLVGLCLAWFVGHWFIVSGFTPWWGGDCFGNRLLADTLPGWILATAVVVREGAARLRGRTRAVVAVLALVLVGWGIFLHDWQGLRNRRTTEWNGVPPLDANTERLFAWRYPQFLATAASCRRMQADLALAGLPAYRAGDPIDLDGANAALEGFYPPEGAGAERFRWSMGTRARLWLSAVPAAAADAGAMRLELRAAFFREQSVEIRCDGRVIGTIAGRDFPAAPFALDIPAAVWRGGVRRGRHVIEFTIRGARRPRDVQPGATDSRRLGLALYAARVTPAS